MFTCSREYYTITHDLLENHAEEVPGPCLEAVLLLRKTLESTLQPMELLSNLELSLGKGLQYFFGKPNTYTPSHMDFTAALNACVIVLDEDVGLDGFQVLLDEVCAWWMIFYPSSQTYNRLQSFLDSAEGQEIKKKMGGQSWMEYPPVLEGGAVPLGGSYDPGDTQPLTRDDMVEIKKACGTLTVHGDTIDLVTVHAQKHGDVFFVPPGYGHYVANARWCIKASLHFIEPRHALQAAMALHVLGPKYFGARNAEDYSDFAVNLSRDLNEIATAK